MKVLLVHHIPVTHCCCCFLRPRREEGCWSVPVVCGLFCCPRLTHQRPSLSWPRNPLEQSSRAMCSGESTAVSWATFHSPPREFPTLDCTSPPRGRLAFFGKSLLWGCNTGGQGHTGIWHGSLVEQQAACKEAAALHPKGKALRAEGWELGLLLPPCLDVKAQSCSSVFSLPPCGFLLP